MVIEILFAILMTIVTFFIGRGYQKHHTETKMNQLTEEINHFILYSEHLNESLDESVLSNLANQIRQLEAQLLLERKMVQLREDEFTHFIENMAHQMKTAITAMQLHLDLSRLHASTLGEQSSLQKVQEDLQRLTDEINWVLNSNQLASGKIQMNFEKFFMADLLSKCIAKLDPIVQKRHVFISQETPDDLEIFGDYFWLQQAIENILKNAIEHTKKDGIVAITIKDMESEIQIWIKDQGKGISEKELPLLFQRYHRGNYSKSGYGIGLHMASDIVKAHHGTITAGNNQDGGAYFVITLPQISGSKIYETS